MKTNNNFSNRFDKDAKQKFQFLNKRIIKTKDGKKLEYKLTLNVRCYKKRKVRIVIDNYGLAKVTCDGPMLSKHRYSDNSLCMWYPKDKEKNKWAYKDGLLCLIRMVEAHLFREAYWREKRIWLGPEFDHSTEDGEKTKD